MKRWMRRLARLYPAPWRQRYGAEFDALLEDAGMARGDLWDILRGAIAMQLRTWNFWKILATCAVAGVLAAGAWSWTLPDRYVSSAVMHIAPGEGSTQRFRKLQQTVLSRQALAEIISRHNLYARERTRTPMAALIQNMLERDLQVQPVNGGKGEAFAIRFAADNPAASQATVQELVSALINQNLKIREAGVNLQVLEGASLPASPVGTGRTGVILRGLIAGLAAGVIAGAIWSTVRRKANWSLRIGAFAAGGMILGITAGLLIPNEYVSVAVLHAAEGANVQAAAGEALSDTSLEAIIRQEDLYSRDVNRGAIAEAVRKMRQQSIRIQMMSPIKDMHGSSFTISFRYNNGVTAEHVTRDLVKAMMSALPVTEVLDPPDQPLSPTFPKRGFITATGAIAGLLLGLAATRFRRPTAAAA